MRATAIAIAAAAIWIGSAAPARACDPYWDWWCDWYDPYWDLPAYEEPTTWWWEPDPVHYAPIYFEPEPTYYAPIFEPEPVFYAPAYEPDPVAYMSPPEPVYLPPAPTWSDPVVWIAPSTDVLEPWVEPAPPAAPVAFVDPVALAPLGTHQVTEVWTGHSAISEGPVTTYTSTSATVDAGTRARLVTTVGTGETTAYDGMLLGGRMTLTDGRVVAGDIYENYAWNGYEWVMTGYVFFQDDAEIARIPQETNAAIAPALTVMPPIASTTPAFVTTTPVPSPAYAVPVVGDTTSAVAEPIPPRAQERPAPATARVVSVGIALAPQADALSRVEVLRGRRVSLWPRATVDGVPATVLRWRVLSGELTALGATSGEGDEPLVAMWQDVSRAGVAFPASMRVTVEVPGEAPRELDASIEVVVLAPAVVE